MKLFLHSIGRDAFVDWSIIVVVSGAVAIALVCIGVTAYIDMDARLSVQRSFNVPSAAVSLDPASLKKVIDEFNAREAERAAILERYLGPGDPSL